MLTMYIMRGLPASGKSSTAKELVENNLGSIVRINRDLLRVMLNNNIFVKNVTEQITTGARDALIRDNFKRNRSVVVDDTNLDSATVKHLIKIADFFGAAVEFIDLEVDVEECIRRDKLRESKGEVTVGENVIRGMHKRFFVNNQLPPRPENKPGVTFEPVIKDESLFDAVIFDIDGTLADHQGIRSPYDYTQVIRDRPRMSVIKLARMYQKNGYTLIILSGREDSCREDTVKWLNTYLSSIDHNGEIYRVPYTLYMRKAEDKRQDRIIKGEIFDTYIRNRYNVEAVYDDRDQVISLWRTELGLDACQVNYGDF